MDCVQLYQTPWFFGYGTVDVGMEPFPRASLFHQPPAVDGAAYGIERDNHPLVQELLMDHLAGAIMLLADL